MRYQHTSQTVTYVMVTTMSIGMHSLHCFSVCMTLVAAALHRFPLTGITVRASMHDKHTGSISGHAAYQKNRHLDASVVDVHIMLIVMHAFLH